MAWDDIKITGNQLTAAEYNTMVTYIKRSVVSKTAAYTAINRDIILCNANGGAFTITLPAASINSIIDVKKTDSSANAVTVDGNGAETIDGDATFNLTLENESISLISDGNNWYLI